jgi:hypothetical protein
MASKDDRVTLKMDRALWRSIEELIRANPGWGIASVSEFVRRAIDSEIRKRREDGANRVITLCFASETKDKHRKDR